MLDQSVTSLYGCRPKIPPQKSYKDVGEEKYAKVAYTSPTEIGLEVEVEKISDPIKGQLSFWMLEKDGSLKDNGFEFISKPFRDENIIYALYDLEKVFLHNPKSVFSHRCSIHVHMNVSKLLVGQLRVLIATYIAVENFYFSKVALERAGNSYCFPLSDTGMVWGDLAPGKIAEHFKYMALNPHHLVDFGTLEFRHHGGTKKKKELLEWIELILRLYSFVQDNDPNKIEEMIMKLNTISNYTEFLRALFKEQYPLFADMDHYKHMRNNVTAAKLFLS